MIDETCLAFAPLHDRAIRDDGPNPPDRISLRDLERSVEIGAFAQERGVIQRLRFNIVVEVGVAAETPGDDVDRILSYDTLSEAVDAALGAERFDLLETLAARIADLILAHPLAARVFLQIEKLDRGPYVLGVEISRRRADQPAAPAAAPRPVVAFFDADAAAGPDLAARIDALAGQGAPLVICPDAPEQPAPVVPSPQAQLRIDLLAREQAAWALSAQAPQAVVAATRTELDWALRAGRVSVWAPSKLMLDTPGAPRDASPVEQALWLARLLDARRLEVFAVTAPAATDIPVTHHAAPQA